jgi:hypothetical protein
VQPRRPFDWLQSLDRHHRRADVRLIATAAKRGWLDGEEFQDHRETLVERLCDIVPDRTEPTRARLTAARFLIDAEYRSVQRMRKQYRIHTRPILRRLRRLERRLAQPASSPIRLRIKALEDRLAARSNKTSCDTMADRVASQDQGPEP